MDNVGRRPSNGAIRAALVTVLLMSPVILRAQATGTMSGYVKDSSGGVIPQARVTATHVQHGTAFPTETDREGFYSFPALDPGEYTVTIEKAGFQRSVQTGLRLT